MLRPHGGRQASKYAAECSYHVTLIAEARLRGDTRGNFVGLAQELRRAFDAATFLATLGRGLSTRTPTWAPRPFEHRAHLAEADPSVSYHNWP
jgi:hypothetical protein